MLNELTTVIGFGFTMLSLIGALIQRDRTMMRQMSDDKERVRDEIAKIRETYLQRVEFLNYSEKTEKQLEKQFDKLNLRLDELLRQRERV
jgi:peptidoglycan hydrolase CwlO-like protein